MKLHLPSRLCLGAVLIALLSAAPAYARRREPQPAASPAKPNHPIVRPGVRPKTAENQEHLQQWMEHHSNLSLAEQLRALDNEPGFKLAPPQTQQRMRDQLVKLYNMTPQQRSRLLEGNEAIERMNPAQRQEFNATVTQYRALPPDRKRLVAKAFRDLRKLPQNERQAIMNTDRFKEQFSDSERGTLSNLLTWEPYFTQDTAEGP